MKGNITLYFKKYNFKVNNSEMLLNNKNVPSLVDNNKSGRTNLKISYIPKKIN